MLKHLSKSNDTGLDVWRRKPASQCVKRITLQVQDGHVKTSFCPLKRGKWQWICFWCGAANNSKLKWLVLSSVFCVFNDPTNAVNTLSMSFQHFSTIFLSTTAGWWGWGGCWWGWKASFIKPMRPAPLLGFPAINSVGDRGLAPGLRLTTRDYSLGVFTTKQSLFFLRPICTQHWC